MITRTKRRRDKQKSAKLQQRKWLLQIAAMKPYAMNTTHKCNFCDMSTGHRANCVWVEIHNYAKRLMEKEKASINE